MIRVSRGYDSKGKQNEHFMVFKPKPGMSEKQIEKALNKAAVEFEREIKNDLVNVGDLRLKELCELWFAEQKKPIIEGGKKVKRTTLSGYKALSVRIYEALGHIRIKKLTVDHLSLIHIYLHSNILYILLNRAPIIHTFFAPVAR